MIANANSIDRIWITGALTMIDMKNVTFEAGLNTSNRTRSITL